MTDGSTRSSWAVPYCYQESLAAGILDSRRTWHYRVRGCSQVCCLLQVTAPVDISAAGPDEPSKCDSANSSRCGFVVVVVGKTNRNRARVQVDALGTMAIAVGSESLLFDALLAKQTFDRAETLKVFAE